MKSRVRKAGMFLVFAVTMVFPLTVGHAAWQPSQPVEFVVPVPPGGGTDILARLAAAIVETEKLAPVPLVVQNRVGGQSLVGLSYVHGKKGDPHVLIACTWWFTAVPVWENVPIRVTQLTPIARLFLDELLYYVRWDSPYKSIKDFVNAAKKAPGTIKVGGGAPRNEDNVLHIRFERAAGIKTNYVGFRGGGDLTREILGGHIDIMLNNPAKVQAQVEAKQVRPLAVASRQRLPGLPQVPTLKEEGYDVVYEDFQRGLNAAPGIPPEAATYYINLWRRITETPRWQAYLKENMSTPAFLAGKEYGEYLKGQEEKARELAPLFAE